MYFEDKRTDPTGNKAILGIGTEKVKHFEKS